MAIISSKSIYSPQVLVTAELLIERVANDLKQRESSYIRHLSNGCFNEAFVRNIDAYVFADVMIQDNPIMTMATLISIDPIDQLDEFAMGVIVPSINNAMSKSLNNILSKKTSYYTEPIKMFSLDEITMARLSDRTILIMSLLGLITISDVYYYRETLYNIIEDNFDLIEDALYLLGTGNEFAIKIFRVLHTFKLSKELKERICEIFDTMSDSFDATTIQHIPTTILNGGLFEYSANKEYLVSVSKLIGAD